MEWGGTDWIALTQDRDRWQALLNAVIDLWGSLHSGKEEQKGKMCDFMMYTLYRVLPESAKQAKTLWWDDVISNSMTLSASSEANGSQSQTSATCPDRM